MINYEELLAETKMISYENNLRKRKSVAYNFIGGVVGILLIGSFVLLAWANFFFGERLLSIAELLILSCGVLAPLLSFRHSCAVCTWLDVQESGLLIGTCMTWQMFISWEDVNVVLEFESSLWRTMRDGSAKWCFIEVKRGLTPFHYHLIRKSGKIEILRGIRIISSGKGYIDTVEAIKEHIASDKFVPLC